MQQELLIRESWNMKQVRVISGVSPDSLDVFRPRFCIWLRVLGMFHGGIGRVKTMFFCFMGWQQRRFNGGWWWGICPKEREGYFRKTRVEKSSSFVARDPEQKRGKVEAAQSMGLIFWDCVLLGSDAGRSPEGFASCRSSGQIGNPILKLRRVSGPRQLRLPNWHCTRRWTSRNISGRILVSGAWSSAGLSWTDRLAGHRLGVGAGADGLSRSDLSE